MSSSNSLRIPGLTLSAGSVIAKKYRIEKLIGEGGTGVVVLARHVQLDQRVAIKFLRAALASDEVRTRFDREARAIGKIESEHVVLVLDYGFFDGSPYMVMEYLEGRDLARVLAEDGPMDIPDAVDCALQVCEALASAHAAGVVHRDLKPANLFLTRDEDNFPRMKVVDFGVSKIVDKKLFSAGTSAAEMTGSFTALGSPRFMAPEQIESSRDVDGRADLWSLGAVLFQLLTGKHLFEGKSNVEAALLAVNGKIARLRDHLPNAPPDLDHVVAHCLTRDINKRFQTAEELCAALRPLATAQTRESLARSRAAKEAPSVSIARLVETPANDDRLHVRISPKSSTSPPEPAEAPEVPHVPGPPGMPAIAANDRASAPDAMHGSGSSVRPGLPKPRGRGLKLIIAAGSLVVILIAFAVMNLVKVAARAAGVLPATIDDRASTPAAVVLDAGRRSP